MINTTTTIQQQTQMITELDKFAEYKYVISEFFIIVNNVSTPLPVERISDFKIEHYFDEATFPIFKVTAMMEPSRYYEIIKNKNNVKFKVRIQSYYVINGTQEKSLYRDVINDMFSLFPDDCSEDLEKELKEQAGTADDKDKLEKLNNVIELFLFKDSFVTGLRSSFNTVLNNVTMCTAVAYLLYKAGVKNVLMSPFENTKSYGTVVLPPQSIEKQIKYLNNNFGFHKKGTMVYFGLLHSYIINYTGTCTAWFKDEWTETVIYVLEKTNTKSFLSGAIIKNNEKRYYYNATINGINIENKTVSSNVLTGTNAVTIDMQNSTTTTKNTGATVVGKTNSAVLFNNSSNPYMSETFAAQQKANSTVISLVLENVNIEAFNPNKMVSMIFESPTLNEKYKGYYKISNALYGFTNQGDAFNVTLALTLKKVQ